MNRRNFLKLFGIIAAVPTSAHALRGVKVPPSFQQMRARKKKREINFYITLENKFNDTHGKHRIIRYRKRGKNYSATSYGEWSDTFLVHGMCVDSDELIAVETQNGTSVSFKPTPHSHQDGKFESVNITTDFNGWNYELVATII